MATTAPDLVVEWGVREILSLTGILITTIAYWCAGRKWDDEGLAAYETAVDECTGGDYQNVEEASTSTPKKFVTNADGSRDAISVNTEDYRERNDPTSTLVVPMEHLNKAMSKHYGMIIGIMIWTLSFLFVPGRPIAIYAGWNICFVLFLPIIAALIAFPMRRATIDRNLELNKKALSLLLVLSTWLVISGIADRQTDAPWYFCVGGGASTNIVIGAVVGGRIRYSSITFSPFHFLAPFVALLLFLSHHIMRRSRKMGITWEVQGRPATDVSPHHLGALCLLYGFFLIWVGTNAVQYEEGLVVGVYVPLYLNYRSWFVFISGLFIIVPANLALDFAFDNGSQPVDHLVDGWLYKLDGSTFKEISSNFPYFSQGIGAVVETPWLLIGGWIFFGICAFMPFGNGFTMQKLMASIVASLIGLVYALQVLPAYWRADLPAYKRWNYVYYSGMVILFTSIGLDGSAPLISSMVGVFFILLGQYFEMLEKKRGKFWIQQGQTNPREVAFSYGNPIHVLGWIILCMGMAIPMM